jgi:hypothetical protein
MFSSSVSGTRIATRTPPSSPRVIPVTRPTITPAILTSDPLRSEPPALRTWAETSGSPPIDPDIRSHAPRSNKAKASSTTTPRRA